MPFLQLILPIGAADPAPYEDALLAAGASSITLEDEGDDPVLEPLPGTTPLWPRVRLKALFAGDADAEQIVESLRAQLADQCSAELADACGAIRFETLADRAWEREWLKDFRPMCFGNRLWICPGGQLPAADLLRSGTDHSAPTVLIELDPGLAFGTGTHPTTALCLEWLDSAAVHGQRVIDYGCGSGILAIAAAKLGATGVVAVDIDPQALIATNENAERNGVATLITAQLVEDASLAPADILLANILAGPLESLAPTFASLVTTGGRLVLSGLLRNQAAAVATRYAPWFDIAPVVVRDDWARLDGVRRPTSSP
jgi:ribosomal protein L11 methyltransferase